MSEQRIHRSITFLSIGAIIVALGSLYYVYVVYFQCTQLKRTIDILRQQHEEYRSFVPSPAVPTSTGTPSVISKPEMWRAVQQKVKNAVVQVFVQRLEYDLLQPYKTPDQYSVVGSGFFINSEELITNAHVVAQASMMWIQVPELGKTIIDVELVGMSPERDLALLRLNPESKEKLKEALGEIPFLALGNSDAIRRGDEVMALGYPLGHQSLKCTNGTISGRAEHMIQISAPINPGSSGGPLVDTEGNVLGVTTSGIEKAQNVGFIIPVRTLKQILPDLYNNVLLRKPFLGVLYNKATEALTECLGNPHPGGCYVIEVVKNSTLYKAGVQRGDMVYEINGHKIDIYGEMNVPWAEDKISVIDYISSLSIGHNVHLVIYRNGVRKEIDVTFSHAELPPVRRMYPGLEELHYEIVGGMVVRPLDLNLIQILANDVPGLTKYAEIAQQAESKLIITHIFPTSELFRTRAIPVGSTINEINGSKVSTLDELRDVLKKTATSKFLTIKVADNVMRTSEHLMVALPFEKVLAEEQKLAHMYRYKMSPLVQELAQLRGITTAA
jgi:serine protease Do